MKTIRTYITLALTLFCFGCGQVTVAGYDVSPSSGAEVSQGVGMTGTSSTATTSTSTSQMSSGTATALAVLGLVALILLSDSAAFCSGTACGGGQITLGG